MPVSTSKITTNLAAAIAAFMFVFTFLTGVAYAQKRVALVIGNDAYDNVAVLKKAVNDAKSIGETLTNIGFDVTVATDLTRREMSRTIQNFNSSISKGDTALLFFAGHGIEIDGENYLLPTDIPNAKRGQTAFIRDESIRLNSVLADLRARQANLNVVILDACRNNPFSGAGERSLGGRAGLARISAPQGTFVMYSADVGEAALDRLSEDDGNPNSVFTRTLIPLMKTPGLDLVDTARETRRRVRELALSVSHEQTPAYYDAVLGDFYFTHGETKSPAGEQQGSDKENAPVEDSADGGKNPEQTADKPEMPTGNGLPQPALIVTAGEKDSVRVWSAEKFSLVAELTGEKKLISAVKLRQDGRSVLVAGEDGSVTTYSIPTFKKRSIFYPEYIVTSLTEATDGTIIVGSDDGLLAAFDGETLRESWRRQAHDSIISPILVRGSQIVTASGDGIVAVTDLATGREVSRTRTFSGGKITDIVFVNNNLVAASHEKGKIAYIDLAAGKVITSFKGHNGWISSIDLTPDRTELVTAGVNGELRYWPVGGNKPLRQLPAHDDVASGAKFLKLNHGTELVSVGFDGAIRIWSQNGSEQLAELEHGSAILYFDYLNEQ